MIKQKEKIEKLHKEASLWISHCFYSKELKDKEYSLACTMISLITDLEDETIHKILENTQSCLSYALEEDSKIFRFSKIKARLTNIRMTEKQRKEFMKTLELIGAF